MAACMNCGDSFTKKSGGYNRYSLNKTIKSGKKTVADSLEEVLRAPITPAKLSCVPLEHRCLCGICYNLIEKIEKRKTELVAKSQELEEAKRTFCQRQSPVSYLKTKVSYTKPASTKRPRTPSKTPRKEKKQATGTSVQSTDSTFPATPVLQGPLPWEPGRRFAAVFTPTKAALSTGIPPMSMSTTQTQPPKYKGFINEAVKSIQRYSYYTAFRTLLKNSKRAQEDFRRVAQVMVRQEMAAYLKSSNYTSKTCDRGAIENFTWASYMNEIKSHLPLVYAVLVATLTSRLNADQVDISTDGKQLGSLIPGLGVVLGILLHLRRRRRFSLIQGIMSSQLFKSGCSQKILQLLNKPGLCLGIKGTRGVIDRVVRDFDKEAMQLKKEIECSLHSTLEQSLAVDDSAEQTMASEETDAFISDGQPELWDSESDDLRSEASVEFSVDSTPLSRDDNPPQSRRSLFVGPKVQGEQPQSTCNVGKKAFGYSLTWDNVQKLAISRHQSSTKTNKFHLWALAFLAENRIYVPLALPTEHLNCVSAEDLPLEIFLPSDQDWEDLKFRMIIIVQRLLVKIFPNMVDIFKDCVTLHIEHEHSAESARKSNLVNLGVFRENPASTKGVINIMRTLNKYVPTQSNGTPYSVLVNGDQLSVERMVSARMSMASSERDDHRFIGQEPSPQEFHKRCRLLQDTMNELYNTGSGGEKGTLYYIRNKFSHRGVKKNVMDCVNNVVDFLLFTTESMLCLLSMQLGEMDNLSSLPKGCPDKSKSKMERQSFFDKFASDLVDTVWPKVHQSTILAAVSTPEEMDDDVAPDITCNCNGEDIGDALTIECAATQQCVGSRFYHPGCVGLPEEDIPTGEWWCSDVCKEISAYCTCKREIPHLVWISCVSAELCISAKDGWFHLKCVGLSRRPVGDWYCSPECQQFSREHLQHECHEEDRQMDHVYQYSCAVLWQGLWHMAHVDAERENDGPAIISQWRLDMLNFWAHKHNKYLILGHRLLSGVNGWLPTHLIEDIIWNRTANVSGGHGCNVGLDLVNEFLNNEFKDNLKRSHGQYTDTQAGRMSKIVGSVGKALQDVFMHTIMDTHIAKAKSHTADYKTDIKKFVDLHKSSHLFDVRPGRAHPSFPNFVHSIQVKRPGQLKSRLKKYALKLEIERHALNRR